MRLFGNHVSPVAPAPVLALLAVSLSLGCAHAKQVETPADAKPEPVQAAPSHPLPPPPPGHPALSASPGGTFEPGAVHEVQRSLRDHGFQVPDSGAIDEATQKQIARFQKSRSLPDTGFPDDLTLRKLGLDPAALHRSNPK